MLSNIEALQFSVEMDAASALLQLHVEPPGYPNWPASRTPKRKGKENRRSLPDFKYEVPFGPRPFTPARGAVDLKVKVTAGDSRHQSPDISYNNRPEQDIVGLPNGGFHLPSSTGLFIRNNTLTCLNQNGTEPVTNGRHTRFNKKAHEESIKMGTRRLNHDIGTQTDHYDDPYEKLLAHVDRLKAKKEELEAELEYLLHQTPGSSGTERLNSERGNTPSNEFGSPRPKYARRRKTESSSITTPSMDSDDDSDFKVEEISEDDFDEEDIKPFGKQDASSNVAMIPIGEGHAKVPSRLLKQLDWSSYSNATRKLLTAVFPRKVLATHSLTGKPSPAFPGKKVKQRLDPDLVSDIIQTVMERCNTTEGHVRTSITTKCADESKMYRNRVKNKKKLQIQKRRRNSKKENIVPRSSSSEGSINRFH